MTEGADDKGPGAPAAVRAASSGLSGANVEPSAAPSARPRTADTAMARRAATRAPAGRRTPRPAEPTVHVKIGRLEVRAMGAAAGGPGATRPERGGRRAPTVSLADYLTSPSSGGTTRR
ncbi:hypothetical protein [Actinomadura sp. 9N215]|uniref:hypothetical protein n=1 Tax=Actinomadura sp. 9N215 TaxID=3375150 RepID=UPI00379578F8